MWTFNLDWPVILTHSFNLGLAFLLALPIAINRETKTRTAGLRTFPIVSVAACGFVLISTHVFVDVNAQARVVQGVITGIGFIGGGAILKTDDNVSGLATAASIWTTGAIGIAVAWGRYEIAIVLSVITFITLKVGSTVKQAVK
ncbi:MgtC/SapB family protein [Thalassotalea mangrovi]|uniref:Protein MgtC n=1 Tax=Thalassotalea mangrovi TaxID=2572245 RepID=A0A4U1BBP1_9GAMM|nr:MgtC/SapB family protein [Thalassotalea mangrovi]TKB47439.1 MgtC/SapB family protein [Thalassotalea mangrovi]